MVLVHEAHMKPQQAVDLCDVAKTLNVLNYIISRRRSFPRCVNIALTIGVFWFKEMINTAAFFVDKCFCSDLFQHLEPNSSSAASKHCIHTNTPVTNSSCGLTFKITLKSAGCLVDF